MWQDRGILPPLPPALPSLSTSHPKWEYRIRTGRSQPHYVKWRGFKRDLRECRKQVQVLLVPLPGQRRSSNATAQKWRSRICGAWRKSGRGGEGSILTDVEVTVNCAVFSGVVEHPRAPQSERGFPCFVLCVLVLFQVDVDGQPCEQPWLAT